MKCHGCDLQGPLCKQTFVCVTCGVRKNTCCSRAGGFSAQLDECGDCRCYRHTGKRFSKFGKLEQGRDGCTSMAS